MAKTVIETMNSVMTVSPSRRKTKRPHPIRAKTIPLYKFPFGFDWTPRAFLKVPAN
jgi:hypothetical protein